MTTIVNNKLPTASARKRRRSAIVCTECRRRKIACDRNSPCIQCVQYKSTCIYYPQATTTRPLHARNITVPADIITSNIVPTVHVPLSSSINFEALSAANLLPESIFDCSTNFGSNGSSTINVAPAGTARTMTLLDPCRKASPLQEPTTARSQEPQHSNMLGTVPSSPTDTANFHVQSRLNGRFQKSRLFGPSHWMNSTVQFEELCKSSNSALYDKNSDLYLLLDKCKQAARTLKARRQVHQSIPADFREYIPPKEICNRLVQLYFRTFESVFRVLHIPTFQQDYLQYWDNPQAASDFFVIKLLLVLAIGTCFYQGPDNPEGFLLSLFSHGIFAAQSWMVGPLKKRCLDLNGIQIQCLYLLAIQTNHLGGDYTWINAGSLLRTAMTIGLHRDPIHLPNISVFQAEIRRRLWATTMELVVQSSLDSGMPVLISCEDFDCRPPLNISDMQLNEAALTPPAPKPLEVFTQTSTQCALMRSLPIRLNIVKVLNQLQSELSYENALRIGTEITKICRSNSLLFQSFSSTPSSSQAKPTAFQIKLLDLLTRRFLLSLHSVFSPLAVSNITYYFSRRVCLESSLLLLSYSDDTSSQDDYRCLRISGQGLFKSITMHAACTICFELITELREDSSPSTSSLSRNDTYKAVQEAVSITKRSIIAGETSVKAHVLFTCALAQIDAIRTGAWIEKAISNAAKQSLESCYAILKGKAEKLQPQADIRGGQYDMTRPGAVDESAVAMSEFFMKDAGLDFDIPDAWLFSEWDCNEV